MNKVAGKKSDFQLFGEDGSRIIIGYGQKKVTETLYEWYEVYFYKKQVNQFGIDKIKEAIIADINARTDEKILNGFEWNGIKVWLSDENQRNFSEAQRMASANAETVLPLTFKLGEDAEGQPVYHTFETVEELNAFYFSAFAYINQCLVEGWQEKDGMDWAPYEALFPHEEQAQETEE